MAAVAGSSELASDLRFRFSLVLPNMFFVVVVVVVLSIICSSL